jgi:hypothetical protein
VHDRHHHDRSTLAGAATDRDLLLPLRGFRLPSGIPAPRTRDWLANLTAEPRFTFQLKHGVVADLPAVATVITDAAERRRVFVAFVDNFNRRNGPDSPWPKAVLEEWVEHSPLL